MRIVVRNEELRLLEDMIKRGYTVGEGNQLRRIVRELNRANAPVVHGYSQRARKVIVALERPLEIVERRKRGLFESEVKINFSLKGVQQRVNQRR